jgi:hypothetical protein
MTAVSHEAYSRYLDFRFAGFSRSTCVPVWRSAVVLRVEALRERLAKLEEVWSWTDQPSAPILDSASRRRAIFSTLPEPVRGSSASSRKKTWRGTL